jgi:hypothetical protein
MRNKVELAETNCGEFLRHANFCDALAAEVAEPVDKDALCEMAERWRDLARSARRQAESAAGIRRRPAARESVERRPDA